MAAATNSYTGGDGGHAVVEAIQKGIFPSGQVSLAPSQEKAEEMLRLCEAHGLTGEFA